jgi:hypothetical protein
VGRVPALEDIDSKQAELIRKVQAAAVFVGPLTAEVPTSFTSGAAADLTALPEDYRPLGLVTKDDAYTWNRETDMAETTSHGRVDPTRRDITSNVSSLAFSAQETNLTNLELYHNVDLSSVVPTAVTGEVSFADPLAPATIRRRLISIGRDGMGAQAIYLVRVMPMSMMSEPGEQAWSDEGELVYPMTFTATPDDELGYAIRYHFGGPGWRSLLTKMGFPALAA